jgi:hypothetical protein
MAAESVFLHLQCLHRRESLCCFQVPVSIHGTEATHLHWWYSRFPHSLQTFRDRIKWNSLLYYWGHYWPIVPAGWWWWVQNIRWNAWQRKPNYSEKTCPSAALFTINLTWSDPGSNPGRRCGKPANNRLSYCAAWNSALVMNPYRFLLYTFRDYCSRVISPFDAP